jgi:methyl-accepting chemotaxis protein
MVRVLGQILAAIKLSVLLLVIFSSLLLVAASLLIGYGGLWLLVPLALVAVLVLGVVAGVNNDIQGISKYLTAARKNEPTQWNAWVRGALHGMEIDFIEAFKAQSRRNAEYKDAVKEMSHSSSELALNAKEVSKSAAYQSSATTSSAAAVTEISHSVEDISSRIAAARVAATQAYDLSKSGSQALASATREVSEVVRLARDTELRIGQLDQLMQNVTNMSQIIREIAAQTNLLALNAAIEAARAGDQGRGFAVVADEVRTLAIRSQGSAADIANNVTQVQETMRNLLVSMNQVVEKTDKSMGDVKQADDS